MKSAWVFLLGIGVAVATAGTASAQRGESPSHSLLDRGQSDAEISQLLRDRLDLLDEQNLNEDLLQQLLDQWKRNPDTESLKRFVENNPAFKDPDRIQRLKEFAEGRLGEGSTDGTPPSEMEGFAEKLKELTPPPGSGGTGPSSISGSVGGSTGTDPDTPGAGAMPPEPPAGREQVDRWKTFAEKYLGGVEGNETFRNMVEDLSEGGLEELTRERFWEEFDWSQYREQGNDFANWVQGQVGDTQGWRLPNLDGVEAPSLPGGGMGDWSSGGGSSSSALDGPGSWLAVIILGVVGATAIFGYWYFYKPAQRRRLAEQGRAKAVRDWPVEPERVRSANELVMAFEHLALWRCGDKAKTWHHREVGDDLARQYPEEDAQARQLAGLYAHARYAPLDEPLSPEQVAVAKQSLRRFSEGVA